ncbi:MAG: RNA methyltransferase [Bacteroidales bacterium]|nr:RNA methyltransferase [Bacteroidales bacterium]
MISSNKVKLISSLRIKKYRDKNRLFIIEGDKLIKEYLELNAGVSIVAGEAEWLSQIPDYLLERAEQVVEVSSAELKKISSLQTPNKAMAIVHMRSDELKPEILKESLSIVLDHIQDPGNMGTIIRLAAWFGIKNIVCSLNCVDLYNPKVVQSTMGALLHVDIYYTDLEKILSGAAKTGLPVFATTLDGISIYKSAPVDKGLILFGNESAGLPADLVKYADKKITIPSFGNTTFGLDSLNVATSVAVVLSEFKRSGQ